MGAMSVYADHVSDEVDAWLLAIGEVATGVWLCCEFRALHPTTDAAALVQYEHYEVPRSYLDLRAIAPSVVRERVANAYEAWAATLPHNAGGAA